MSSLPLPQRRHMPAFGSRIAQCPQFWQTIVSRWSSTEITSSISSSSAMEYSTRHPDDAIEDDYRCTPRMKDRLAKPLTLLTILPNPKKSSCKGWLHCNLAVVPMGVQGGSLTSPGVGRRMRGNAGKPSIETDRGWEMTETNQEISERLTKSIRELQDLEKQIQTGQADATVLRDFRKAVDNIRRTAWVVQSWLEKAKQGTNPYPLLPLLAEERIRRATQLCGDLSIDLETMDVTYESEGLPELSRAISRLNRLLGKVTTS